MKNFKYLTTTILALTAVFALSACDGEAEDAGEKLDEIATDAGNAVEDACEDLKEAAKAENKDC
ncbi:hypothetical protein [uncultured Paraglaciecola sp.]|uniref:hypothetical protein n=1 Tax=uncultured Paraglaciecola sp. TaxID=1765024 RepID=UPI0030D72FEE|tara:strand:- start:56569 stop:56760 length:192 start_codon:yes stop_codon:yes gene_type:complete